MEEVMEMMEGELVLLNTKISTCPFLDCKIKSLGGGGGGKGIAQEDFMEEEMVVVLMVAVAVAG